MTFNIVTREEMGMDPVVRNSNGTPRPRLVRPYAFMTYHYTGVNVNWGDVGDTVAEITAIERYAAKVGKPNEYNTVIHQDPDDLIHQYAGDFRAAHSAGENSISHGVLLLNGIKELPTQKQVHKVQWLTQLLRYVGLVDTQTWYRGHRDMPNAATACPGALIYPYVQFFSLNYDDVVTKPVAPDPTPEPKPPVPVPPPDSSTGFGYYLVTEGRTPWGISAEVYGTGTKYQDILDANEPDDTPNPGERWLVPGFTGTWYIVQEGDSPWRILEKIFGSGNFNGMDGVEQFYQWNGGENHQLQPGERVWVRD